MQYTAYVPAVGFLLSSVKDDDEQEWGEKIALEDNKEGVIFSLSLTLSLSLSHSALTLKMRLFSGLKRETDEM